MKNIFFSLILVFTYAFSVEAQQIDTLNERFYDESMSGASGAAGSVQSILNNMNTDGSFKDVTYGTTNGVAETHPIRLNTLAQALNYPGTSWYNNQELKNRLFQSIEYWCDLNLQDSNWWWRYIGYPKRFWSAVVLSDKYMAASNPALKVKCIDYLEWAWKNGTSDHKTGANLADIAATALPAAAIDSDSTLAQEISSRVQQETEFAEKDGIHSDWSFSQHTGSGLQLYSGSYGSAYAISIGDIAYTCRNTAFKFSDDSFYRFENFLLEGVQWTSWKNVLDYNSTGRAISRTNGSTLANGYLSPISQMMEMDPYRKNDFQEWYNRISKKQTGGPVGNRMFWRHDFMVQRGSDWYASVRATSTRTVGNESGNGEGLRDYHMADGVFMHMYTGNEYVNIFPVWDWHMIPGITSQLDGNNFPLVEWGQGATGGSDFAGGASDGNAGIITMIQARAGVNAKKAWFMTPECIVAVSSGITSYRTYPIFTTIEQNTFVGSMILKDGTNFTAGDLILSGRTRLFHNKTLYENLDSLTNFKLSVKTQTGSWSLINTGGSTSNISMKVFSLGIDHGIMPINNKYAYGIIPNASKNYQTNGTAFPAEVLVNSESLQVIRLNSGEYTGGVFYQAGAFVENGKTLISVDKPCVLLLNNRSKDTLIVNLADPARKSSQITVSVSGHYNGQNAEYDEKTDLTSIAFTIPTAMYAGSTVNSVLVSLINSIADNNQLPTDYSLSQNYPNPFNPSTVISFSVPKSSNVQIRIFDGLGRVVRNLTNGNRNPGTYKIVWDATDNFGRNVSSGIYFYILQANNVMISKKMLFLK